MHESMLLATKSVDSHEDPCAGLAWCAGRVMIPHSDGQSEIDK